MNKNTNTNITTNINTNILFVGEYCLSLQYGPVFIINISLKQSVVGKKYVKWHRKCHKEYLAVDK